MSVGRMYLGRMVGSGEGISRLLESSRKVYVFYSRVLL